MEFNNGDIIYTTCPGIPLCYHVGILAVVDDQILVFNNTPGAKNKWGGNVVAQPLEAFMKKRKLLKVAPGPGQCTSEIVAHAFENRHRTWDALAYNCEDYVNEVLFCKKQSRLRNLWQSALAGGILYLAINQ